MTEQAERAVRKALRDAAAVLRQVRQDSSSLFSGETRANASRALAEVEFAIQEAAE